MVNKSIIITINFLPQTSETKVTKDLKLPIAPSTFPSQFYKLVLFIATVTALGRKEKEKSPFSHISFQIQKGNFLHTLSAE